MSERIDPIPVVSDKTANKVLESLYIKPDGTFIQIPVITHTDNAAYFAYLTMRRVQRSNHGFLGALNSHLNSSGIVEPGQMRAHSVGMAVVLEALLRQPTARFSEVLEFWAAEGLNFRLQDLLKQFTLKDRRYNPIDEVARGPLIYTSQNELDRCLQHASSIYGGEYPYIVRTAGAALYLSMSEIWPVDAELLQNDHRISDEQKERLARLQTPILSLPPTTETSPSNHPLTGQ